MSDIAPGWYKDPAEPTVQRYWDGEGWIGDPLPIDATPPPGPPRGSAPPPRTRTAPPAHPVPAAPPPPAGYGSAPPGWPPVGPPRGITPAQAPGPPPGRPAVPPGIPWVPSQPGHVAGPHLRLVARPYPHGLPLAPLGLRVLARLIDLAVLLGLNVLGNGWLVYLYLKDVAPVVKAAWRAAQTGVNGPTPAVPDRATYLMVLIPIVTAALWLAYEVPAIAQRGQTLGKRVVGIKVLPLESTKPLGFARALRRWNPLGLPVLLWTCGLGFVLQFVDAISPCMGGPLQLALHDRSAGTVVVQVGRKGHEITPIPVPEHTPETPHDAPRPS